MNDIKVVDTLNEIRADQEWWNGKHHPIEFFAEAVARTRVEEGGVSIKDIANCFKAQFDKDELLSLISELNTPEITIKYSDDRCYQCKKDGEECENCFKEKIK